MPESPYVKDPLNPTSAELSAAIERGLANGTVLTVEQFLEKAALLDEAETEADREAEPEREPEAEF